MTTRTNNHLSAVFIGAVNSGKSTTAGHLLHKCGAISKRTIQKFEQETADQGKASFKYAWVLDKLKAEREREITIDIGIECFEAKRTLITVIDAPGHHDYTKNMITGASQADFAILVISAATGEYEDSIHPSGQTCQHLLHAFTLGVRQIIVAVNKMDTIGWSEVRFDYIIKDISSLLRKVGYNPRTAAFTPISGYGGDNMLEESIHLSWFRGGTRETKDGVVKVKTLLDAIESIVPPPRATDKPLRLPIRDVYNISGIGIVPTGRIITGVMKPGMDLTFAPTNNTAQVVSIEMHHKQVDKGTAGDIVGFNITDVSGDICRSHIAGDSTNNPPKRVASFTAQVIVLDHPGQIRAGYTPIVDCYTAHIACEFSELLYMNDRRNGSHIKDSPEFLKRGDAAMIKLVPSKPMCMETFSDCPALGRFIIRDKDRTVGVGVVRSVENYVYYENEDDYESDDDYQD
ncbi:uncharacterized protein ASPGLDRAFT_182045 [Aspergillus glaucus CBS 516.65]|uniref:Elongation factor 1-alpha n=1 Tax=Aspergillus glaucus CBS 516.65 TaxID=1160497 RepID=A0A1L9V474_ASPGL|nr:hypothetical protein ASPGLDRAFT_182519 [Aspergillus glaucus CBS 516.65]XP_022395426.1 hypothetical protein ASPGLDRAFT_182045 [Aspergillus glaucus CBS 516.65]OJJ78540.1 hypothetical protein ASPGLDRAFT_182519 [Aspergillus glaucus CBS 516.65]OJJ78728.1 hypothetical protein ASPGLDRAFT_182045 [Aspergillus glaucus CBS 516.65]